MCGYFGIKDTLRSVQVRDQRPTRGHLVSEFATNEMSLKDVDIRSLF